MRFHSGRSPVQTTCPSSPPCRSQSPAERCQSGTAAPPARGAEWRHGIGENRHPPGVAATPETVKRYVAQGDQVIVQAGASAPEGGKGRPVQQPGLRACAPCENNVNVSAVL
ncbi:hypothetical protein DN412_30990 [Cupriavidus lacunae]|uniref:Uncharacterized protein n=1 Tax=Cupriavidus lacunae TaxID=2666307 RepID=A0A370NLN7_9BURK|nr:hypothetical protein DN412_30990 [Cupriavidus lacunae]